MESGGKASDSAGWTKLFYIMDLSLESSGTSDEECLEAKLARLNHNFTETLEAARKAQEASDSPDDLEPGSEEQPRALSLRFPQGNRLAAPGFEDERFSEDAQYSFGMDFEEEEGEKLEPERQRMLLEDAYSQLLAQTQPQRLLFSPQALESLKNCLAQLKPGDEADVTLGHSAFVLRLQDSDEIARDYAAILEATETLEEVEQVQDQPEEQVLAAEAPDEGAGDWEAKMEEYQSAWDLLLEQRRELEMRESQLVGSEEALRNQYVALEKARLDLDTVRMTQEKANLRWNEDLLKMKKVVESLLQKIMEETLLARDILEDPQQKQRRRLLEKDLSSIRDQAWTLLSSVPDTDLNSYLDQAEDALIEAVRTGKTAKFKIRLSALRTKVASVKTAVEIQRHNSRAAGLNSALETIANEPIYTRSKASLQTRLLERYSIEAARSVSPRARSPPLVLSPTQSILSQGLSEDWQTRSTSVLPGRLSVLSGLEIPTSFTPRRSPVPESGYMGDFGLRASAAQAKLTSNAYKELMRLAEERVEKWRTLACDLQAQVSAFSTRESQLSQAEAKCRSWEKRLIALEKELRNREETARLREVAVSRSEDNLLLRAGKFLTASEAQDVLDVSYTRLQASKHDIEAAQADLSASKAALSADQIALQERTRLLDHQWREVKSVQTRLAKGTAVVDSIQKAVGEFLTVLKVST